MEENTILLNEKNQLLSQIANYESKLNKVETESEVEYIFLSNINNKDII